MRTSTPSPQHLRPVQDLRRRAGEGPGGTDSGRWKAIEAKLSGDESIVIWGDGTQTRSFMYIDDCVDGTQRIMHSDITEPINLGSDELVTINELVDVIEAAVEVDLEREYDRTNPEGVRGSMGAF